MAEEKRHKQAKEGGEEIIQETQFYDDETDTTTGMRGKEYAHDYRYFPEPDLVPIEPSKEWIEEIRNSLGELPEARKNRFVEDCKLSAYDAGLLTSSKTIANFFEKSVELYPNPKEIANWLTGTIAACLNENKMRLEDSLITPADLKYVLEWLEKKYINRALAKDMVVKMTKIDRTKMTPIEIEKSRKEKSEENEKRKESEAQISNEDEIINIIKEVLKNNPGPVEQYKKGKTTAIGFLVGQVMKATKGRANPGLANKLLKELLK
jgi:aspartyl-tRNA(Asn)/glutamyl-tRNA(Gln) amidotransferase subunit B